MKLAQTVFPGVGLGLTVSRARRVTEGTFLEAAKALADRVPRGSIDEGTVLPGLLSIRDCSLLVACATARWAVKEGYAEQEMEENLEVKVQRAMWFPEYLPIRYEP